ncbi:hypothetical protein CR513_23190, partial [Mucuna pruriens]
MVSQRKYILDLHKETGTGCRLADTPIDSNKKLCDREESAEAEYRAMTNGVCEMLWLKRVLEELHIPIHMQMKLYCDNKAAISIA